MAVDDEIGSSFMTLTGRAVTDLNKWVFQSQVPKYFGEHGDYKERVSDGKLHLFVLCFYSYLS